MAFENLISVKFTAEELQTLDTALDNIAGVLRGKTVNLTPGERQQYGSIAEQNKLFVNKAKILMEQNLRHIPSFLDKAEFDRDHAAREQIVNRLQRLAGLTEQLKDTKVVLDHDNYQNALSFYRNIKFLSKESVAGTTTLYEEMKQFFKNRGNTATRNEEENNL